MGGGFFNEKDLNRIGAVKSFFEAFAFRTIAYNLEHVVSLIFFDDKTESQCGFTEAIYDFNQLISIAKPRGSTLMYDAIMKASSELVSFKTKYPNCILRIIALTDGEDTGSSSSV
jgi:ubiquitin-conjugating enzyme E2 D/E